MFLKYKLTILCLISLNKLVFSVNVPYEQNDKNNDNVYGLKVPKDRLVQALRDVFKVPEDVIMSKKPPRKGQSPPQYMLDLYKKMKEGQDSLPMKANTVRCIMPLEEQWRDDFHKNMLIYNISQASEDNVLASNLHLPSPEQRRPRTPIKPRIRPRSTRVQIYLVKRGGIPNKPADLQPLVISLLAKNSQDVDISKVVKDATKMEEVPFIGIKVEELRRGKRWTSLPPHRLVKRTPPLLIIYSMVPIWDVPPFSPEDESRSRRSVRDTSGLDTIEKRAIGSSEKWLKWLNEVAPHHHKNSVHHNHDVHPGVPATLDKTVSYSLLTNELPGVVEPAENNLETGSFFPAYPTLNNERNEIIIQDVNTKETEPDKEEEKDYTFNLQKRKKKNRKRKKNRKNSNMIPHPEGTEHPRSKPWPKWEKGVSKKSKRKNKKLRGRKIPDVWMQYAMNVQRDVEPGPPSDPPEDTGKCGRRSLHVNFKEIGWDHMLAPTMFDAYYCAGTCSDLLTANEGGTNHALLQSLLRYIWIKPDLPAPCCVPDKLDSLTLLYYNTDDINTVTLMTYPKMSVQTCSCQ